MSNEREKLDPNKAGRKKEEIDASKKLRVGIIGTGWIAEEHVKHYLKMPDVQIVAGADLIPGKADAFFKEFGLEGVRTYPNHTEMLKNEQLDTVSICTYNATHAECAVAALNSGVHVLLEKPMCVTLDEAVDIVKAEKKSGKVLSIGFQPRYDANMKMIKKIVEAGELGQVYYIQTGGGRRWGIPTPFGTSFIQADTGVIGAMGDIGCYSLDMVLNAVGYPKPLTVSGYTSNFFGKNPDNFTSRGNPAEYAELFGVEDFAAAFVRLEGGIVLDFRIAWVMNLDTPGDTIIYGTKASLRIPSTDCWNGTVGGAMKIYKDVAGVGVETEIPILQGDAELFYLKIRSFLDAVKNGGKPPVPSEQIIINQAIIDGIVKSARLGREIEITIPEI
ncbi:MAG: Gfo/Idh/MocA family oxidoreductase [Oscillospiraceae bacterium]|jgi:predicted dehydrogenase|nr:Gfo/Idh/MocA family oxidoreductase [Oscillospiraceae bacterium]